MWQGREIINLNEFLALDDATVEIAPLNEHGVFYPNYHVAIFNDGVFSLWGNPAKTENGWRWSFDYDWRNGGGGSFPHKNDKIHTNKSEIINDALSIAQRYNFPMDDVRRMVGKSRVVQQTLFD